MEQEGTSRVRVIFTGALRDAAGGPALVVTAATVREAIETLVGLRPALRPWLVTGPEGRLAGHVRLYVNRQDIRRLGGADTPLADGDELAVVVAAFGGEEASRKESLVAARVLVVGVGGLGSPVAESLAAAGVGTIGLLDSDSVDVSNLQRQVIYATADLGRPKADAAAARLGSAFPGVCFVPIRERLTVDNAGRLMETYDLVVDGSDNLETRYALNQAAVALGKPLIHGSVFRFEGQVTVVWPGKGPCYRCLYPAPPPPGAVPTCQEAGVLGPVPGVIGAIEAAEAVKVLMALSRAKSAGETGAAGHDKTGAAGHGVARLEPGLLTGRLILFDALSMTFEEVRFAQDPACPACGGDRGPAQQEIASRH